MLTTEQRTWRVQNEGCPERDAKNKSIAFTRALCLHQTLTGNVGLWTYRRHVLIDRALLYHRSSSGRQLVWQRRFCPEDMLR